jgi:hypothetical protein
MPKRKVLVAGASGLVGFAGEAFAQLPDWEAVGVSRRIHLVSKGNTYFVDLTDTARCAEVFSQITTYSPSSMPRCTKNLA